jgi:hypothetical protein
MWAAHLVKLQLHWWFSLFEYNTLHAMLLYGSKKKKIEKKIAKKALAWFEKRRRLVLFPERH